MWYGILLRLVRFDHFIFKLMSKYIILHLCIIVFSVFFEYSIVVHFYIALECLILFMLFHIVLHCIILSFIAFHCMSCVFPYYIVLYYYFIYWIVLCYFCVPCIVVYILVSFCFELYHIVFYYFFFHILRILSYLAMLKATFTPA